MAKLSGLMLPSALNWSSSLRSGISCSSESSWLGANLLLRRLIRQRVLATLYSHTKSALGLSNRWDRLQENFLRGILRIFTLSTHLHAEGKNRVLQQSQRFFYSFFISLAQKH